MAANFPAENGQNSKYVENQLNNAAKACQNGLVICFQPSEIHFWHSHVPVMLQIQDGGQYDHQKWSKCRAAKTIKVEKNRISAKQ